MRFVSLTGPSSGSKSPGVKVCPVSVHIFRLGASGDADPPSKFSALPIKVLLMGTLGLRRLLCSASQTQSKISVSYNTYPQPKQKQ